MTAKSAEKMAGNPKQAGEKAIAGKSETSHKEPESGTERTNNSESEGPSILVRLVGLVVIIATAALLYKHFGHLFTLTELKRQKSFLDEYVTEKPVNAAAYYVVTMTAIIGFTVPGATFVSVLGGFLFPQPFAFCLAFLGYICGATISYSIVRFLLGDFVKRYLLDKSPMFRKFERGMADTSNFWQTVSFLVFIRYVAFFPFWFVNSCCAVLDIGYHYFVITTAAACFPGAAIYTLCGSLLAQTLAKLGNEELKDFKGVIMNLMWEAVWTDPKAQIVVVMMLLCAAGPFILKQQQKGNESYKQFRADSPSRNDGRLKQS